MTFESALHVSTIVIGVTVLEHSENVNRTLTKRFTHLCKTIMIRNIIVKSVMRSAIRYSYSTFGEHFRYLCYKYDLSPISWISPLCNV